MKVIYIVWKKQKDLTLAKTRVIDTDNYPVHKINASYRFWSEHKDYEIERSENV